MPWALLEELEQLLVQRLELLKASRSEQRLEHSQLEHNRCWHSQCRSKPLRSRLD